MNNVTRRIRELKTGRVKKKRLSMYPSDVEMTIRPKQKKGYKQLSCR